MCARSPEPRGGGYVFAETVAGGWVPKQYFQSVDKGAREYFERGPLGFPVVDVKVVLTDGTYHAVDSSDAAFQQATHVALTEAMPKAEPILLEPIVSVQLSTPSEATPRVQRIVTGRRGGQLLGYDRHPSLRGWDVVLATVPQAELYARSSRPPRKAWAGSRGSQTVDFRPRSRSRRCR